MKKVFLEILQKLKENICDRVSFLIKSQAKACNLITKETLAKVFSCAFSEISKNTISNGTPSVAASVWYNFYKNYLKENLGISSCQYPNKNAQFFQFLQHWCKKSDPNRINKNANYYQ